MAISECPGGVSAPDWHRLSQWNQTCPLLQDACIHDLIRAQAQKRGKQLAVSAWDGSLTYQQVDDMSDRLAYLLRKYDITANKCVVSCLEKSRWAVVAILAILKAGGTYVPVDPAQPTARHEAIFEDCQPSLVLCSSKTEKVMSFQHSIKTVRIDSEFLESLPSCAGLAPQVAPEDAALILYTSGSTGKPMGVITEHRSLSTSIFALLEPFSLGSQSRMLQFAAFIWSPSTCEIFGTLLGGGCLFIPSDEQRTNDPAAFIRSNRINTAVVTPTFLRTLGEANIDCLQTICLGGELVTGDLIDRYSPSRSLFHAYGSSETGLAMLSRVLPQDTSPSVGYGVGCRVWIVDPQDIDRLSPIGEVGELLLQGWNLARGYLNDETSSETKFPAAPRWISSLQSPGPYKFCRTNDLARYNPDGSVQMIGRKDAVFKIRGMRVDPNDVEYHVRQGLGAGFDVVVGSSTFKDDQSSKLFVVITSDTIQQASQNRPGVLVEYMQSPSFESIVQSLRSHLQRSVPSHMLPAFFLPMGRIPRLITGKADRKLVQSLVSELDVPDLILSSEASLQKEAPRLAAEHLMREVWSSVLRIRADRIGIRDHFFMLGGDSMLAMRVASELRQRNLSLTVQQIFLNPTLSEMSCMISPIAPSSLPDEEAQRSDDKVDNLHDIISEICTQYDTDEDQIEDIFSCTPLQEGMLSLSTLKENAYVVRVLVKLSAEVDVDKLKNSWDSAFSQHQIMRTRILHTSQGSMQVVVSTRCQWREHDDLESYLRDDKEEPLLCAVNTSRVCVIQTPQRTRHIVWTVHHAVFDAWSMAMFLQSVETFYRAGQQRPIVSFKKFSSYLSSLDCTAAASYWRDYLAGSSATVLAELPPGYRADAQATLSYTATVLTANNKQITPASILRASWALILGQQVGNTDVCFGTTINGRAAPLADIEHVMGPTIATVPVRIQIDRSKLVSDYLQGIQDEAVASIPFEQLGLQHIRRLSDSAAYACAFQSLLIMHSHEDAYNSYFLDSKVEIDNWGDSSSYPLNLACHIRDGLVEMHATYDSTIFSEMRIRHLLHQFEQVANELSEAGPIATLSDIDGCSSLDQDLFFSWNRTFPSTNDICLHDLLQPALSKYAASVALATSAGSLTYRELDVLSSKLAKVLFETHRVRPETLVPLCFDKTRWVAVAMLGVWKAGGGFIPLDPVSPQAWIDQVLEETDADLILCSSDQLERFGKDRSAVVIDQEYFDSNGDTSDVEPVPSGVLPSHIAFILYTSGTTGRPKGIVHEHRTWASGIPYRLRWLNRDENSRVVQASSFGFDTVIEDIWSTILLGGTVCMPTIAEWSNDALGFMNNMRVTTADLTPSLAEALGSPAQLPFLTTLCTGGEPMTRGLINKWSGHVHLMNAYGPTEVALLSHATGALCASSEPSNIGHSFACLGWIVQPENHDRLVPFGSIGELVVEGPTLARGYLKNEQQTRRAFVSNPTWLPAAKHGVRKLYKTGDLARHTEDGSIILLGRKDTQVKIRGVRVELTQVENHVQSCLPFANTVITELIHFPGGSPSGNLTTFVGFVGLESEMAAHLRLREHVEALSTELSLRLPRYMIPDIFVAISGVERTVTGKADRKRLCRMAKSLPKDRLIFPLTRTKDADNEKRSLTTRELRMCSLWRSVLNLDEATSIGPYDTFIQHGGDSISAMRLVVLGRHAQHRIRISGADVLRYPRLTDMASVSDDLGLDEEVQQIAPFTLLPRELDTRTLRSDISQHCAVPVSAVLDIYPCTPLQEGILALSSKLPGAYVSQHVFRLPHETDIMLLEKSWEMVVARTPISRTRFYQTDLVLLQAVLDGQIEWARPTNLASYLRDDAANLTGLNDPLMRYALIKDGDAHIFVWTQHHALYDGWSMSLTLDAVETIYRGESLTRRPDFNVFINHISKSDSSLHEDYWKSELAALHTTDFFPRLPCLDYTVKPLRSQEILLRAPRKLHSATTLPDVIYAAWALATAAYTSANDVIFGTTLTGRNLPLRDVERVIGPTFTTVPVRVRFSPADTIDSLLLGLAKKRLDMISHEHFGLHRIQRINQDTEAACRFHNILIIQSEEQQATTNSLFKSVTAEGDLSLFNVYALMVQIALDGDKLSAQANYDHNVIDERQLQHLFELFEHIMLQLGDLPPLTRVDEIERITAREKMQLMEWNNAQYNSTQSCIHEKIEAWVEQQPSAQAVVSWDGDLSYLQLLSLSRRLALRLRDMGVQPESTIALLFEKSKFAVIAALAVLEAGGSFVFLNPNHPAERLRTIVKECRACVVVASITCTSIGTSLLQPQQLITLSDKLLAELPEPAWSLRISSVQPSNKASIVFTSGSTGKPKGIVLQHSTICASVEAHGPAFGVSPSSRVIAFADLVFDMALYEIFTTLMRGGCICIPCEHDRINDLVRVFNHLSVNWAFFTPSTVSLLQPADVPTLRTLVVGGEPMRQEIIDTWANSVDLIQCSGPAETTVSMFQPMDTKTPRERLGRSLGGVSWIVDPANHDALVPIGAIGELVMEGPIVARGYLSKEDSKAGGFIENPRWARDMNGVGAPARRMFRCGDLVRYSMDGAINFIARKDNQVKLRGQRVEIAEVEHHIKRQLGDQEIAVAVVRWTGGENLVLFVAPRLSSSGDGPALNNNQTESADMMPQLRAHLSTLLPGYMIPSFMVKMESLPLNDSGKIDRRRLIAFGSSLTPEQTPFFTRQTGKRVSTNSPVERALQRLWATCLALDPDQIGAEDNFLQLGGDSVSAMRLVAMALKKNITITVADIFQAPVLRQLARRAIECVPDSRPGDVVPFSLLPDEEREVVRRKANEQCDLKPELILDAYPCSALQEGLIALSVRSQSSYVAQQVFELADLAALERLKNAFETVVSMLAILRTRFIQLESGQMIQVVTDSSCDWTQHSNLEDYLREDVAKEIRPGKPLTRFASIVTGTSIYVVWTIHHALYDGWSLPRMVDLIEIACTNPSNLATAPESITEYNVFIRHLIETNRDDCNKFWKARLDNATVSPFPVSATSTRDPVPRSSMERKISLLRTAGSSVTTSNLLIAAWSILVSRMTDTNDVVFGLTVSGRNHDLPGIEDVVGPTIATVPFRVQLDPGSKIPALVQSIQHDVIEMIKYQQFGLQNIRKLGPHAHSACDFQNILVIQPQTSSTTNGTLKPVPVQDVATFRTYPLTLIADILDDSVVLSAKYDDTIMPNNQVRRMLGHLERIVNQLNADDCDKTVAAVDMTTIEDEAEIGDWNSVEPKLIHQCIHRVIESQAQSSPDSPAVDSWDGQFTYAELNDTANRLADHLIALGVPRRSRIPVCFEKSKWTQVAVLAILKAGSAFLLLDPSHPYMRLENVIRNINAPVILCSQTNQSLASSILSHSVVVSEAAIQAVPITGACRNVDDDPQSPAYLIPTSGTTGTPKISVIHHEAYCSGAHGHIPKIHIDSSSRVYQFASYAFDTCIEDILTTLMVGGCICVPADWDRISNITGSMTSLAVNWAHLTPSVSNLVDPKSVPTLKILALGGEALTTKHVARWADHVHLINVYGPSECCVTSLAHDEGFTRAPSCTIGRAVGCVAWIVTPEDHQNLTPIGAVGELLIEGPIVAQGYLGEPEKSAAAFIPLPGCISKLVSPNRRLSKAYLTGDLVRYDTDGRLFYVGRKGSRAKLRGQRIELGEVEHQISRTLPDEGFDVAVDVMATRGSSQLVAFVGHRLKDPLVRTLTVEDADLWERWHSMASQLSFHLSTTLPHYMIPSYYVPLSNLPMSLTNKMDRRSLEGLFAGITEEDLAAYQRSSVQDRGRKPTSELERLLQGVWSKVLNQEPATISANTSFTSLGGDSITAMQVLAHTRRAGYRPSIVEILHLDTIEELARYLESTKLPVQTSKTDNEFSRHVPAGENDQNRTCDLAPIQESLLRRCRGRENEYQLSFVLKAKVRMDLDAMRKTFEHIARAHPMLRARFVQNDHGKWTQSIRDEYDSSYEVLENAENTSLESLVRQARNRISLGSDILFAAVLQRQADCDILAFAFHHLIFDLVSWRIFVDDLQQLLQGVPPEQIFRSTTAAYIDWCDATNRYALTSEHLDSQQAGFYTYWAIPREEFRTEVPVTIKRVIAEPFRNAFSESRVSAALVLTMARSMPDREHVVVHHSSHGRINSALDLDVSRTIGWFTTFQPVDLTVAPDDTIDAVALRVHKARSQIPTDSRASFGTRDAGLMEIAFNYTGRHQAVEIGSNEAMFEEIPVQVEHYGTAVAGRRSALFEIVVHVGEQSLEVHFTSDQGLGHRDRIDAWQQRFFSLLADMSAPA